MKHARAVIREYVQQLLTGRPPIVSVERSRTTDFELSDLPAVRVSIGDEQSENASQGSNPTQMRAAIMEIELHGRELPGVLFDDVLDEMALVCEQAIAADPYLGGHAKRTTYTGMRTDYSDDQSEGRVFLGWEVVYFTKSTSPESPA